MSSRFLRVIFPASHLFSLSSQSSDCLCSALLRSVSCFPSLHPLSLLRPSSLLLSVAAASGLTAAVMSADGEDAEAVRKRALATASLPDAIMEPNITTVIQE